VAWDLSETSNESHAESSIVWLLGWALVLPFAHPGRLFSYGLITLVLLMVLTILYPAASVFAPILATSHFEPQPPSIFIQQGPVLGVIVLVLSSLALAFLVCIWQRDIVHRFRDPIGLLLTTSLRWLPQHLIASVILCGLLVGYAGLPRPAGLAGFVIGSLILPPLYARLAFLGPVIVTQGVMVALPRAWRAGKGHTVGHALVYTILGLAWLGSVYLISSYGIEAAAREQSLLPMLLADCAEVAVTFFFILWTAAIPALIVRRRIVLQGIDTSAFD